jgi:ATP-binding cassette subfamily G (WHITE) protein 2 (SNQ2)
MFQQGAEGRDGPQVPLHHVDEDGERSHQTGEDAITSSDVNGTWGERDVGGPVDLRHAMLEYEEMRKELTNLSRTKSRKSVKSTTRQGSSNLHRQISRGSHATVPMKPEHDVEAAMEEEKVETPEQDSSSSEDGEFELGDFLKDGHFEKRKDGESAKKVGVVYKNLSVLGVGATTTFVKTLPSAVIGVSHSIPPPSFISQLQSSIN